MSKIPSSMLLDSTTSLATARLNGPRLNVGCGPVQPAGWINVDNSRRARLRKWAGPLDCLFVSLGFLSPTEFGPSTETFNLLGRWPFADNTVVAIYGGEVFEHFTRSEGERFLGECYRVLAPGGVLRLRVPDNYQFWKNYVAEVEECISRCPTEWTNKHSRWVEMFFREICVNRPLLGSIGHFHKWAYDEVSLTLAFRNAGFVEVTRRAFQDSRISGIDAVEVRDNLIVEGVKSQQNC